MKFLKLDIQLFAHHKGQGSTSNGRDSAGRRLGAKAADGEFVTAYPLHSGTYRLEEVDHKVDGYLWNKVSHEFTIGEKICL